MTAFKNALKKNVGSNREIFIGKSATQFYANDYMRSLTLVEFGSPND